MCRHPVTLPVLQLQKKNLSTEMFLEKNDSDPGAEEKNYGVTLKTKKDSCIAHVFTERVKHLKSFKKRAFRYF